MQAAHLNWVDYIIVGIFLISVLAGLMRGLVKEVIAIVTWIAAFIVATLFASPLAMQFTGNKVTTAAVSGLPATVGINAAKSLSLLSISVSFIAIFIFTLIVGSLINYFVSRAVDMGGVSIGNRLLGGIFGLMRGFLVNLIFIFLVQLSPLSLQTAWMQSLFVQSFKPFVEMMEHWVSPGLEDFKVKGNSYITSIKERLTMQ